MIKAGDHALKASGKARKTGTKAAPEVLRGSKADQLEILLRRPEGATITFIARALNWQPHSVRGALSGTLKKKRGFTVVSTRIEGGERVYRISE